MRDCTICVAKTKALVSCAVTAQLICDFLFAYANIRFSPDAAQIMVLRTHVTRHELEMPAHSRRNKLAKRFSKA